MVCQTCSSTNPGGQAFCGTCGHRLAAETIGSLTERVAKLEDQLHEAVHGRVSAHNLELETAENVMARVRRWTTLILFYAGIPAAIRNTLFDPFISSGKSNGTGLGLAIVSKIVHDHYGSIAVEQTGEAGTVFVVKFPRSQSGIADSLEADVKETNRSPA